jgi:hypothetical protein
MQWLALLLLSITSCAFSSEEAASFNEAMPTEWQDLCSKKAVKQWYIDTLEKPELIESDGRFSKLPILNLYELRDSGERFDRKFLGNRQLVEKAIATDIEKTFKGKSLDEPIRLLSLGSFGLLQDFFIVGHLVKQGRTHIELAFVGASYDAPNLNGMIELKKALSQEGVELDISTFKNLQEFSSKKPQKVSAVYSIDAFRNEASLSAINDIILARKQLTNNGQAYLSFFGEAMSFGTSSGIRPIATSQKTVTESEGITAAQLKNPRSKDSPLRVVVESTDPYFFFSSLLYSISDLFKAGYQDIVITILSHSHYSDAEQKTISQLFSTLNGPQSQLTISWKNRLFLRDQRRDRIDLSIFWADNYNIKEFASQLNRGVVILGSCMPEQSRWIICGKDLGVWEVDGKGAISMIDVPQGNEELALAMLHDLFQHGSPWYKYS